jgi:hypothetical protein
MSFRPTPAGKLAALQKRLLHYIHSSRLNYPNNGNLLDYHESFAQGNPS